MSSVLFGITKRIAHMVDNNLKIVTDVGEFVYRKNIVNRLFFALGNHTEFIARVSLVFKRQKKLEPRSSIQGGANPSLWVIGMTEQRYPPTSGHIDKIVGRHSLAHSFADAPCHLGQGKQYPF